MREKEKAFHGTQRVTSVKEPVKDLRDFKHHKARLPLCLKNPTLSLEKRM